MKGALKIQQVDMQKDDFIIVESEESLHIEVSDGGPVWGSFSLMPFVQSSCNS